MLRLPLLLAAALAVCLVIPSAAAFEISLSGLDTQPPALAPGETHDHAFGVSIASTGSQNIICATDGKIVLDLAATKTDDSLGLGATIEPSTVEFTIPAGAYLGGASQTWAGSEQSATIKLTIGDALPPGHDSHTFGVKASFDGTVPSNCQGDFPESSAEENLGVPLDPPAEEEPTTSPTEGGAGSPTPDTGGDAEESPVPGFVLAFAAVGLAALLRRRTH